MPHGGREPEPVEVDGGQRDPPTSQNTHTPAWTGSLGLGDLGTGAAVLAGEMPGGKFLSGEGLLMGAVTVT